MDAPEETRPARLRLEMVSSDLMKALISNLTVPSFSLFLALLAIPRKDPPYLPFEVAQCLC